MSKWFLIVLVIIILASIVSILVRVETRRKANGADEFDLSADDFEMLE